MKQGALVILRLLCFVSLTAQQRAPGSSPAQAGRGPVVGAGGAQAANGTAVLVLGAGTPTLTAERSGTCLGVIANGTVYLFDAGPGVERRMFEARARTSIGNIIRNIGPVFISHLHSDHTLGLPAMLYYVRPQGQPFKVYGPPGIKNMMNHILAAWQEDRDMRVNGRERANPVRWETDVHEVTSGVIFKDDNVTVMAFEVPHGSWEHAFGYRIDSADRSIVISGDTRPSNAIVKACNGCDILFHEVVWEDPDGPPRSAYMREFHTSPAELANIAVRANAKMVVMYHQVGVQPPAAYIRLVAREYKGPVAFAQDLDLY